MINPKWRTYALGLMALAIPAAALGPSPAWADVTTIFDVSGDFDNGSTLAGTVTVDVTTGNATAIDVTADSFDFTDIGTQISETGEYIIGAISPSNTSHLFLTFPVANLVNYAGGSLSSDTQLDNLQIPSSTSLTSGAATPSRTAEVVPELSTWAMMLIGFAGLAFAGWKARSGFPSQRAATA